MGSAIVMERLNKSLKERIGSRPVLANFAPQMISRLETLHELGFIHRDQKPSNWMFKGNKLYLIDFGLSISYLSDETEHIKFGINEPFVGTHLYASPHPELGIKQSRRDDMISLGFVLISLYRDLPWSKFQLAKNEKVVVYRELALQKLVPDVRDGIPIGLFYFIKKCLELDFEEVPPYNELRKMVS
jgi:serine/threonine protein kinase